MLVVVLIAPASTVIAQTAKRPAEPPVRIEINARTIDAFDPRDASRRRFGQLEFRGGLVLSSSYRYFGGLSGLHMFSDGERFLALTDRGRWLRARIVYSGARPIGVADAEMAPILGADGHPLAKRGWYDTESLTADNGTLYVGIERVNRIVRFDYARQGLLARGQPIQIPDGISKLPYNGGLECLAAVPKNMPGAGTLIAISERGHDSAGNIRGFLIGGPGPGEFALARTGDFDVSDCAVLPSRDIAVLERRFGWLSGIAMRLRRIALATLVPGALVSGRELLLADMGYQIDNMEGLGIHRAKEGEVVLTLISDDNFSALQRNILLQFTLLDE